MKKIKSLLMKVFPFYRRRVRERLIAKVMSTPEGKIAMAKAICGPLIPKKCDKIKGFKCPECGKEEVYYHRSGVDGRVPHHVECSKCGWNESGYVFAASQMFTVEPLEE